MTNGAPLGAPYCVQGARWPTRRALPTAAWSRSRGAASRVRYGVPAPLGDAKGAPPLRHEPIGPAIDLRVDPRVPERARIPLPCAEQVTPEPPPARLGDDVDMGDPGRVLGPEGVPRHMGHQAEGAERLPAFEDDEGRGDGPGAEVGVEGAQTPAHREPALPEGALPEPAGDGEDEVGAVGECRDQHGRTVYVVQGIGDRVNLHCEESPPRSGDLSHHRNGRVQGPFRALYCVSWSAHPTPPPPRRSKRSSPASAPGTRSRSTGSLPCPTRNCTAPRRRCCAAKRRGTRCSRRRWSTSSGSSSPVARRRRSPRVRT